MGLASIAVAGIEQAQFVVYGRLIKNTILLRSQTYSEESGLKADDASLPSAPSSFFALNLNDHKLMFLPETSFAPTLQQFASTLQSFMRAELASFIRAQYEKKKLTDEPKTLGSLMAEYPSPDVKVTPLAGDSDVDAFVESFSKITRLEFQLLSTNAEVNRGLNFRAIRDMKDAVAAESTKLIHENKQGLKKSAVADEVKEAASGGNQKVKFTGIGDDGARFDGSNDDFKLKVAFTDPPQDLLRRAVEMVRTYFMQVAQKRLRPDIGKPDIEKLAALRKEFDGSDGRG